ncbi:MAG TPA: hypothetical protein VH370_03875 [Humisphaera sp.]|jgi:hypothetical protein|nr:hypothetical protein [Humisphaera sp.]
MSFNQQLISAQVLVVLLGAGSLTGCGPTSRDVTNDPSFSAGYKQEQVYRLVTPVVLMKGAEDHWKTGTAYYLTKPQIARSLEENRHGDKSLGSIEQSSRLRTKKIIAFHVSPLPFYWHDLIRPVAVLLDGPRAGTDVDIAEISRHVPASERPADIAMPSSNYLQLDR